MDSSGNDSVIGFQGPGAPGNGIDVYARRYASTAGPHVYCTAKINSQGCLPGDRLQRQREREPREPVPDHGDRRRSTRSRAALLRLRLVVHAVPRVEDLHRAAAQADAVQNTGGNPAPNDCSGALSMDFNARIQSGIDPHLVPGTTVGARWYYRDSQDPAGYGTGLTDAVRFTICP